MSVFMVDYENVGANGLSKIEKLSEKDVAIIFYSENRQSIPFDAVDKLFKTKADVLLEKAFVKIKGTNKSYHDALDNQLIVDLGLLIGTNQEKETQYYIVSNDRGFGFVCERLRIKGFSVKQIESIAEWYDALPEHKPEFEKEVCDLIEETKDAKTVARIMRDGKTNTEINNRLQKEFGGPRGQEYFRIIKPLITNAA